MALIRCSKRSIPEQCSLLIKFNHSGKDSRRSHVIAIKEEHDIIANNSKVLVALNEEQNHGGLRGSGGGVRGFSGGLHGFGGGCGNGGCGCRKEKKKGKGKVGNIWRDRAILSNFGPSLTIPWALLFTVRILKIARIFFKIFLN